MRELEELLSQISARQPGRVGIGANNGHVVDGVDALDHVLDACGLRIAKITPDTRSALDALLEWYFSGAWMEAAGEAV